MAEQQRYITVTRTASVTLRVRRETYGTMTDDEIRDFEMKLEPSDAFQALVEAVSIADENDIDQSVKVVFE